MTLLQPIISHAFDGQIWRLQIDEDQDIIGLEIRNGKDKQTSFAAIDLNNGELYFKSLTLPERWLIGIEAVTKGVMLLHYYKHQSSPEHKGIIAIDVKTGKELWANYSLTFDHLTDSGCAVYNTNLQPKKLQFISLRDGGLTNYSPDTNKPSAVKIVVPDMVPAQQLSAGLLPDEPYGNMVHYLNHNGYIIVSLHTSKSGVLQQHLYVLNDGKTVYHDLLNSDIQKLQPEAFVVHKNTLIYIKNKAELKALQL